MVLNPTVHTGMGLDLFSTDGNRHTEDSMNTLGINQGGLVCSYCMVVNPTKGVGKKKALYGVVGERSVHRDRKKKKEDSASCSHLRD